MVPGSKGPAACISSFVKPYYWKQLPRDSCMAVPIVQSLGIDKNTKKILYTSSSEEVTLPKVYQDVYPK